MLLVELMDEMPCSDVNSRSRGVATVFAIVSGLAPGWLALTEMVGKSTAGRSLTGKPK